MMPWYDVHLCCCCRHEYWLCIASSRTVWRTHSAYRMPCHRALGHTPSRCIKQKIDAVRIGEFWDRSLRLNFHRANVFCILPVFPRHLMFGVLILHAFCVNLLAKRRQKKMANAQIERALAHRTCNIFACSACSYFVLFLLIFILSKCRVKNETSLYWGFANFIRSYSNRSAEYQIANAAVRITSMVCDSEPEISQLKKGRISHGFKFICVVNEGCGHLIVHNHDT